MYDLDSVYMSRMLSIIDRFLKSCLKERKKKNVPLGTHRPQDSVNASQQRWRVEYSSRKS